MQRSLLTSLVSAIAVTATAVLAFVLISRLFGPLPLSLSQTIAQKQNTFDVSGESEISVVPDNAKVTVGIEARNVSSAKAKDEANQKMTAIQNQLDAIGIEKEDMKTENYSMYPEYNYTQTPQRITGYVVSTNLVVTIKDFEKINEVIDGATNAGANQVGGVQFTLSDEQEKETKAQARKEAIEKAKENASELSGLAGMRLGKIVNVFEAQNPGNAPMVYRDMKMSAVSEDAVSNPTQIEPGSTKYKYSVTLSYETL